jgi:cyanate lyase
MNRGQLVEKILDAKREKRWTWKHITEEIGGMSPILVVGALLGQMKLPKSLAEKAGRLFGLSDVETRMLNEIPTRGAPMPPTDPLLYRFYELVMVNGPALKALIEEEFGDGIMSAIDFESQARPSPPCEGRPRAARHVRQIPALQILRHRTGRSGVRIQGGVIGSQRPPP